MVRLFVLLSVLSLYAPATLAANGHAIKQRADAVLTLMSYTVVPDVTASDLNIGSGSNDKHNLAITQFGGGRPERVVSSLSRRNDGLQPLRPAFCGQ